MMFLASTNTKMNSYSPEQAVQESARNYRSFKFNVDLHESSTKEINDHFSGVKALGHEALSKAMQTEDSTKNGIYDKTEDGKSLMQYQGDSLHEGAINEAQAAGIQLEVQQVQEVKE
jgi:hypothetical protein